MLNDNPITHITIVSRLCGWGAVGLLCLFLLCSCNSKGKGWDIFGIGSEEDTTAVDPFDPFRYDTVRVHGISHETQMGKCYACDGTGKVDGKTCEACNGNGEREYVVEEKY